MNLYIGVFKDKTTTNIYYGNHVGLIPTKMIFQDMKIYELEIGKETELKSKSKIDKYISKDEMVFDNFSLAKRFKRYNESEVIFELKLGKEVKS